MDAAGSVVRAVLAVYPDTQAVYLFGSCGTKNEWPDSDADIALLLTPDEAKRAGSLAMSELQMSLERLLGKDVDLINLRQVSTVFQKEVIGGGKLIHCADPYAVDEFEMLVISYYQKLNEERRKILASFIATGRAYAV